MSQLDVAILGGGNGGYACALRAAQLGLSVALVESNKVGGTCLHIGCIPTKALLHSADVLEAARSAGKIGISISEVGFDWPGVLAFKDGVVSKHFRGLQGLLKRRGVNVVEGRGRLAGPGAIDVEGAGQVTAANIVLATGSYARSLPFIDVDGDAFVVSDHCLSLGEVPESLIVIGAGAVGLEFASLYQSFGSKVTVVEALDRIAPGEDEEISAELSRHFRRRKIDVFAGARVLAAQAKDGQAVVEIESEGDRRTITARRCLVAVGRGPVSDGLGYEEAGVKLDRGFVVADENCRTGIPGVWAVGDLITQPSLNLPFPHFQLAHVAFGEGIHVAEQIAGAETSPVHYTGVPRATYCAPEIASVGLTEQQAGDAGHRVKTARFNWAASGKASILGEAGGFIKVVSEEEGPVLGVHMIGPRVTELISEAQMITNWEALASEVAALIHPHPTLSEGLGEAMLALAGKPLHG